LVTHKTHQTWQFQCLKMKVSIWEVQLFSWWICHCQHWIKFDSRRLALSYPDIVVLCFLKYPVMVQPAMVQFCGSNPAFLGTSAHSS
jgi:hypothetical protein